MRLTVKAARRLFAEGRGRWFVEGGGSLFVRPSTKGRDRLSRGQRGKLFLEAEGPISQGKDEAVVEGGRTPAVC
jgi:hypothetical protein